jgi:hypothetical protein
MTYTVTAFGAVGDGVTLDTGAIQAAIDACATSGGGRVTLPGGYTFLSGSLLLRPHVNLHLEDGAVLRASGDYADYSAEHDIAVLTGDVVREDVLPRRAFIAGYQAHGCSLTGRGVIDGNADAFILERGEQIHVMRGPAGGRSQYLERPFTVFLIDCDRVRISDVLVRDPAFWALRLTGCHQSVISGIRIHTDLKVPNADGIDVDRCRSVEIVDCELITADDCISLKSCAGTAVYGDVADVHIARCVMTTRSGAITLGTESVGAIRDVVVEDCQVRDSHRGLAVRAREGGVINDVVFRRCRVQTRTFAPEWWGHGEALHVTAFRWSEPDTLGDGNIERTLYGRVADISFEDIQAVSEAGTLVWGQVPGLIDGVHFREVAVEMRAQSTWPARIDLRPNDVEPVITRPHNAFEFVNAAGVTLESVAVRWDGTSRVRYGEAVHQEHSNVDTTGITESHSPPGEN